MLLLLCHCYTLVANHSQEDKRLEDLLETVKMGGADNSSAIKKDLTAELNRIEAAPSRQGWFGKRERGDVTWGLMYTVYHGACIVYIVVFSIVNMPIRDRYPP